MLTNTLLFGFEESGSNTASMSITAACMGRANTPHSRLADTAPSTSGLIAYSINSSFGQHRVEDHVDASKIVAGFVNPIGGWHRQHFQ